MSIRFLVLLAFALAAGSLTSALAKLARHRADAREAEAAEAAVQQRQSEALILRSTAKRRIARQVLAGRVSLLEAASLFAALNRMPPASTYLGQLDCHFEEGATPSEGERLCRQVIEFARVEGHDAPPRACLVRGLEQELARLRGAAGIPLAPPASGQVERLLNLVRDEQAPDVQAAPRPGDPPGSP